MEKQRWEESEKRREEERRSEKRKSQKTEDEVREKVQKLRITVFFKWFVAPEGRKVGSLKWRVQSHLARWEMKYCTPLWSEAHVGSQNVQSTPGSEHFWKLRCRKSARRCGAKHISKSKCTRHHMLAPLLKVQMRFCVAGAKDSAPCQKWAKPEGFVAFPNTMAGVGHLQRICRDACRMAGAIQEFIRGVRRSGRWLPERGWILEHQICRLAKMILRDRCSTLHRWSGNIAKRIGTRPSALHATFHFWRTSRRIASFSMLSTSKIEEVSQNSFVFDIVKLKHWGSLEELCCWRCHMSS